jgi:hypothetical protein
VFCENNIPSDKKERSYDDTKKQKLPFFIEL